MNHRITKAVDHLTERFMPSYPPGLPRPIPDPEPRGPVSPVASEGARQWDKEAKSVKPRCEVHGVPLGPKDVCPMGDGECGVTA